MDINLTPFIKIAGMGGAGYLWGSVTRTDARMAQFIWLISELAVQIFRSQSRPLNRNEENLLMLVGALGATAYMSHARLVTDIFKACLCAFAIALSSTMLNELLNNIRTSYELHLRIRPLVDPTMIRF